MQKPDRSVYTPTDFLQWRETDTIDITPKFQRRGVWKAAARSYFVDTLLRSMPVPPIYLRVVQSKDHSRVVRQVVDGQQRVSAVLDFIDSKYRLSRALGASWAGKTFDDLTTEEQQRITSFSFSAEIFHGISDLEVLEIFARLNTYSVPLNAQELRNGRYFGPFKQCAYSLAHEHLEFWRQHRVFTEGNIARMLEVEFVSEAMIAQIDGMQDKKKSINEFYARNDEEFPRLPIASGTYFARLADAEAAVLGSRNFRLWANPTEVISRSRRFFPGSPGFPGSRHEIVVASSTARLQCIAAVRHRIVHGQKDARLNFDSATRQLCGKRYRGARPGRFLRDWDGSSGRRWLESIGDELCGLASQIA